MLGHMEITEVSWSDLGAVRRYTDLTNAVRRADSPWAHPMTPQECVGELRYGWDGEPATALLASVDGVAVAAGEYETTTYDNRHLAWLGVEVHPEHRRRGHGSALWDALVRRARAEGRTSAGIDGWDAEAPRGFAARHGIERRGTEVNRRQHPRELDRALLERRYDEAVAHAASYELVRWPGETPSSELAAVGRLTEAINDAPKDDIDLEDEVFPAERIAAYEAAQAARGRALHRVCARHRRTGELAGHTVVAVDGERPHLAEQHDTAVAGAHRGHRLGLLLKLEMLRWLAEAQPQLESIDTWNAESNGHMVGVNEALGYQVVGRALAFQRSI